MYAPVFPVPINIPQRGRVAVIGDDQDAVLRLLQSNADGPPDRNPAPGDFLWNELWTAGPDQALDVDRGWAPAFSVKQVDGGDWPCDVPISGGVPRAGVLRSPVAGIPDTSLARHRPRALGPRGTALVGPR